MSRPRLFPLAALLALAICGPALASGANVIRDCTDDEVLSKTYTQKEYKDALAQLSSDSDQYGNCRAIIKRAQLDALRKARDTSGATGGGGGAPTGGGTTAGGGGFGNQPATKQLESATPDERTAVDEGRKTTAQPVNVAGAAVKPGIGSSSDLPTPLLILLVLVLAGGLALAAIRIRALVLARRA